MKRCSHCRIDKPEVEFYRCKNRLQAWCKECHKNKTRKKTTVEYRCEVCDRKVKRFSYSPAAEAKRGKRCTPCGRSHYLAANGGVSWNYSGRDSFTGRTFATWKVSAKRRNHDWAVTKDYLQSLFEQQNGICALSGIEMQVKVNSPYRPSLDRKDSSVGYIAGNCQFVCSVLNVMKNKLLDVEFIRLCRIISEYNEIGSV